MKYNISGFYQPALLEYGLDGTDAYILDWFVYFTVSGKMFKEDINNKTFYWCKYQAIIDDLPCIGINNKESISRRFDKYVNCGLIEKYVKKTNHGTYTMFYINPDKLNYLTSSTLKSSVNISKVECGVEYKVECGLDSKVEPNNPYTNVNHSINNPSSNNQNNESLRSFLKSESNEQKLEKEKDTDISDEKTKNDVAKNQRPPSDLEIVEKYFIEKYEKKYGNKPDWVFVKNRTLIKQLFVSQKIDVIMKKIDMYFENEYWFNKKSGRNFGSFRAHYNDIVEIEKDVKDMTPKEYARYGMKKLDERHKIINLGDYV